MNLSNRLTFSLVFSIVLVAALAFIVAPATAQVTVTAYQITTDYDGTADPVVPGKIVITFTYSENPNPRPDIGHFTAADNTNTPADDDSDRDVLTTATATVGGEGKIVTFTVTNATATAALPTDLQLRGYSNTLNNVQATTAADVATVTPTALTLAENHMAGYSYRVYARVAGSTNKETPDAGAPHLPTGVEAVVFPQTTDGTPNADLPLDFEEFFNVGGGTIDLVVPGAANLDVIINEIMWGLDNSRVGQDGHTYQQWIEVYNRKTTPVPNPTFIFTDDTFPAPAKADNVVDRISNIAGRQNVWNPPIKGSSGTATRNEADTVIIGADPAFVSLYRSKQDGDGTNAGHWTASNRLFFPGFTGTPGGANTRGGLPGTRANPSAATPPKNSVIINEVFNSATADEDWIELRNVGSGNVNIKNWRINRTDGSTLTEHNVVQFANKDTNIPAGEVLLIVNKDPVDTNLAAGIDIREGDAANQQFGAGSHKYLNINRSDGGKFNIPDMSTGFLILRNNGDNKFRASRTNMHDVVGYSRLTHNTIDAATDIKEPENGSFWKTDAWPINGNSGNAYRVHNAKDASNGNASLNPAHGLKHNVVWARRGTNHGWRKDGGSPAGFNGGIGYDRGVKGNGTPGYHNDVVKGKTGDITDGGLIISELMLTTDNGRYPQWIELHNTSRTRGINLSVDGSDPKTGWRMIIENHNSGSWSENDRPLVATINLKDFGDIKYIPPNQTVLIVSRTGRHSAGAGNFPTHRVASVWGTPNARNALKPKNSKDAMLNAEGGFYIKIVDGDGNVSDEIGNLDGKAADVRKSIGIDDPYSWLWPTETTEDDERTSLIRLMEGTWGTDNANNVRGVQGGKQGTPGTARKGVPDRTVDGDTTGMVLPLGIADNRRGGGMVGSGMMDADGNPVKVPAKYAGAAWVHAVDTDLADAQDNWYGSDDDVGTPLHTAGTPLPVSLSFFRPTLEDGKVVIRWTTESELDNAGFNILRSQDRNGEFTKVNDQLIQGKGTTAERSTYKWVDTSAKPGAVYYYQIEDVSFAGERNTLTTTKLKGLISAKDKLTTRWGELKEVQ